MREFGGAAQFIMVQGHDDLFPHPGLADDEIGAIFGIELDHAATAAPAIKKTRNAKPAKKATAKKTATKKLITPRKAAAKPAPAKKPVAKKAPAKKAAAKKTAAVRK